MKNLRAVLLTVLLAFALHSCSQKQAEVPAISGLETYTDESTSFSIKVPQGWSTKSVKGERYYVLSDANAESRFVEFKEGPSATKIDVRSVKLPAGTTLEQYITEDMMFQADQYVKEQTTLGGAPATKLKFEFDLEDGRFKGEKIYALKDSMITTVEISAFGGTYDANKAKFDEILSSITLASAPKPKTVEPKVVIDTTKRGPEPPSDTLINITGSGYGISIPKNFRSAGRKAAGAISSTEFLGSRLDCTIRVDVIDASKQNNLDKIVESNKAVYSGSSVSGATLGGATAKVINYSPAANIGSRVYFAVKGDRLYRLTMNYFKPEQGTYLPIFEKSVGSFQFK